MNKAKFVMMRGIAALAVMSLLVTMTIAVTSPKDAWSQSIAMVFSAAS